MNANDFCDRLNTAPSLTAPEWAAGQALASFMDADGRCRRPIDQLAARCRLGERAVRRALDGLEARGLIARHRRRDKWSRTWAVTEYHAREAATDLPVGETAGSSGDFPDPSVGEAGRSPVASMRPTGRRSRILSNEDLSNNAVGETSGSRSPRSPSDGEPGSGNGQASSAVKGADGVSVADCGDAVDDFLKRAHEAHAAWKASQQEAR